jgi:hypothetical protein
MFTLSTPPRPADGVFLWYGASYNNWSFQRPDGTPFMTAQEKCFYCVASATVAWIDYVWTASQGDLGHRFTQDDFWINYFGAELGRKQWSGYNTSFIFRCSPSIGYNRRLINASQDDGVDPYGQAWGIFDYTPGGFYYQQNVYNTGTFGGVSFATHGLAHALASYSEPAGVVIENGGHYVLVTAVEADENPTVNFWTPLRKILIRDPFKPTSQQVTEFRYDLGEWDAVFTPYGYEGTNFHSAPNCGPSGTNCRDEMRTGPYAGNLWWGRFVTIERGGDSFNPDTFLIWN